MQNYNLFLKPPNILQKIFQFPLFFRNFALHQL